MELSERRYFDDLAHSMSGCTARSVKVWAINMNHGQQSLCTVSPIPCTLISMNYLFHCLTPPFFPVPKGMDKDEATADSGPRPIAAIESVFRTRFRESLTAFAQLTDVCLLSIYIYVYLFVCSLSLIYIYINLYQHVHLNGFDCVCVRVSVSCVCTCSTFIHVALWQFLAHCSETICLRVPSLSLSLSLSFPHTHHSGPDGVAEGVSCKGTGAQWACGHLQHVHPGVWGLDRAWYGASERARRWYLHVFKCYYQYIYISMFL